MDPHGPLIFTIFIFWLIHLNRLNSQLSIKAFPNTWLPKTLTSVQLQPIIIQLCPAMLTYSPSNHSPQYNNIKHFLFLVLGKLIQKLGIALSWNNWISSFFFPKVKRNKIGFWKFYHSLFMAKIYTQVHFPPFPPSSSIWNNCLKFLKSLFTWF